VGAGHLGQRPDAAAVRSGHGRALNHLGGNRAQSLERLDGGAFDLLVIGCGVLGAATAWAAARAGASVAVVDRADVAGATSSASSKLLHGGLRYLAMGDVRLVREAHAERRLNARVLAPHLVRPLDFIVPVRGDSPVPLWKVRAGVWTYSWLARFADGPSGRLDVADAVARVPGLRPDGLRGTVLYHDHQTHDGRLTLAALQAAAAAGAVVAPYAEVVSLRIAGGRVRGADMANRLGGAAIGVAARAVVNATGPWVDHVRRLEAPGAGTSVRLAKGAHLLLNAPEWRAAVTTPLPAGRVSFAIPWEGMLLLGTTDEPYDSDPAAVAATDDEQAQILAEAARSLEPGLLDPAMVRSRFAGLRVLPLTGRATSATHRETVITTGPAGMVSVAGGKLTTWRAIGAQAAGRALGALGMRPPATVEPLPGAADADVVAAGLAREWPQVDADIRQALARHYGSVAGMVLERARERPELLERIRSDGPDVWAQVPHARDHEWAATAGDVLRGRTTVVARGGASPEAAARAAAMLAEGGW
jgi:glycerol-3-phosphate dehydrogenase